MRIYGLDFTSTPSRRKPLILVSCALQGRVMRAEGSETLTSFEELEAFLASDGPWVCGMDFPFGQPRGLVEALGWPPSWEGYVGKVSRTSKDEFEDAIKSDMALRPPGSKFRYRLADRRSRSTSAMRLFRVPVGKMFYRGAPLLLRSGVSVEPCRPVPDGRVAVEAYPAVVARRFLGREGYKSDERSKQTDEHREAREKLVAGLGSGVLEEAYGFTVGVGEAWRSRLVADPMADELDSLLCAVQAAWAYTKRDEGWGVPEECDRDEGWILDPELLAGD
ncbi:DUF429 domain-containing protein [Rubrobacter marinus]|uniref:DUF429 domain-containing protein n=1 Tax=Rubrobacter marinus TaxID=2653852 RepID=UPI00140C9254|nr:DUF429 domain-containing protein [Rubrobacter marinus]